MLQSYSECTVTLTSTASNAEPCTSLRERKKLATRRSLRRIALGLVTERGFAHVTVDDIAAAADVSRAHFQLFPVQGSRAVSGVMRASMTFWAGAGGAVPLSRLIDLAFRALADGLRADCALRHVSTIPGGRSPQTASLGNVADRKDYH